MSLVGNLLVVTVLAGGTLLLWFLVRFGLLSPLLSRGATDALRAPDAPGVEALVGYELPPDAEAFYRLAPFLGGFGQTLVGPTGQVWCVAEFYPLTPRHVREARKVHGVTQVPLAAGVAKDVYLLLPDGSVAHRAAGPNATLLPVAQSLAEFGRFSVSGSA